jgi:hypothetical protein
VVVEGFLEATDHQSETVHTLHEGTTLLFIYLSILFRL